MSDDPASFALARLAEEEPDEVCGCLNVNHWPPCVPQPWKDREWREVEAGRRIAERHRDCATGRGYCRDRHIGPSPCPDLADLLYRWAGHPDYRPEWKP
jgi:hypothetical protein